MESDKRPIQGYGGHGKTETVRETHLKVMRAQTTLGEKIVGLKLATIAVEEFDDYVAIAANHD